MANENSPFKYKSITIREIFKKFKIVDTRISEKVLDIEIIKTELKDWKKDESKGEKIIITGEYKEPMIKADNNTVYLSLEIDPMERWNHCTILKWIPDNFTNGRIYNIEGIPHTIT